jgi:hypothetical protein
MTTERNRRASDRAAELLAPHGSTSRSLPWLPMLGLPAALLAWFLLKVL